MSSTNKSKIGNGQSRLKKRNSQQTKRKKSLGGKSTVRGVGRGTTCILCGDLVPAVQLLAHKALIHGENNRPRGSISSRKKKSIWTPLVSGGLPSLGKNSR
jgi:hypothetical protein